MKAGIWHRATIVLVCCAAAVCGAVAEAGGRAPADEPMARSQALADALREAVPMGAGDILHFFKLTFQ